VILMIGTNPRHEAAIINTRLRKSYLHKGAEFGLIGEKFDGTFEYDHLGESAKDVEAFLSGKVGADTDFGKAFKNAKKPLIMVGSAVAEHKDGEAILKSVANYVNKNADKYITPEWNGLSVLQRVSVVMGSPLVIDAIGSHSFLLDCVSSRCVRHWFLSYCYRKQDNAKVCLPAKC
jgi:NADH dehydrogenase (ubiquinone) Fe-S protein 1